MKVTTLGDLSQSFALRQRNVALRTQIDDLTRELATGRVADVRQVLDGNFSYLTDLERRETLLNGYDVASTEAGLFAGAMQDALGIIEDAGGALSLSLMAAGTSIVGARSTDAAAEARSTLDTMIAALNTNAAGRYLFSGTASDRPPLSDADTLLTALRAASAGATTPADLIAAAEAWFDDPAGFTATIYQGGADGLAPFELSRTEQVTLDLRATDPRLRDSLKLAAVAALAEDPAFGFDLEAQTQLFEQTGQALRIAQDDTIALRGEVGFAQSQIDKITARNGAERTSLEFAKLALLEADPFEAATRLEEAQFQLESLYAVTVRMSQLSLLNYL